MIRLTLRQVLPDSEAEREETFKISQDNKRLAVELWPELHTVSAAYVNALASKDPAVINFVKMISQATGYPLLKTPARYPSYSDAKKEIESLPSLMGVKQRLHTLSDKQLELLERIKDRLL